MGQMVVFQQQWNVPLMVHYISGEGNIWSRLFPKSLEKIVFSKEEFYSIGRDVSWLDRSSFSK